MIVLPFPPAILAGHAGFKGGYAKARVTKEWRAKVGMAVLPYAADLVLGEGDIAIAVRFVPPSNRGDRCNFPNRMKPVFDGIADALGVNDSRFVPAYTFAAPEKPGRIEITIAQGEKQ